MFINRIHYVTNSFTNCFREEFFLKVNCVTSAEARPLTDLEWQVTVNIVLQSEHRLYQVLRLLTNTSQDKLLLILNHTRL